jgi:hypothetical protein
MKNLPRDLPHLGSGRARWQRSRKYLALLPDAERLRRRAVVLREQQLASIRRLESHVG